MCRMIAAVGGFEPGALRRALVRMAANDNPAYDHERRAQGAAFRHLDGWGAAWIEDGKLHTWRRTKPLIEDEESARIDALPARILLLHARRATAPDSVGLENTHPFSVTFLGRDWAFCHNGAVRDVDRLRAAPGLMPAGATDSERVFHHFLAELADLAAEGGGGGAPATKARIRPEAALAATIRVPRDYTALHCLVASNDGVVAAACRHPVNSLPEYHALWLGEGSGVRVVSSEPVDGLNCEWTRLPEPGVVTLEVS